jgi:2-keto-3-deoxy-6-phosphogluconate aldolase
VDKRETLGKILYRGLVPIITHDRLPPTECLEQVVEAGLEAVEISCRHPEALALISMAKRHYPELAVGAATLVEDGRLHGFLNSHGRPVPGIDEAVDAGADFLVSMLPFRQGTYESHGDSHVIISGVDTIGEAQQALDWGANLLKFTNPHLMGGPEYFRSLDPATYASFPYYVTGGIRVNIAPGYVEVGVLAIGAGFDVILGADYVALQAAFDDFVMREKLTEHVATLYRARQRYQADVPFGTRDALAVQDASGRCLNV